MGIKLNDMQGADSAVVGSTEDFGEDFIYNVDVSVGETVTLTGDWSSSDSEFDGPSNNGDGNYHVSSGLPSFGTFSLDSATGAMSWSFTYDDLLANGGLSQSILFRVSGTDQFDTGDTDDVTVNITCFLGGTTIGTPSGETAVETLRIGDMIRTADGRSVAVKWIGRTRVDDYVFLPAAKAPVVISAGALGQGLPHSDLYLSADHALELGGMLVTAGALVNDSTIRFAHASELPATFTYYHIETEEHDVILANGVAAETYVDVAQRRGFDNHAEYVDLYGAERIVPEMALPRVTSARLLPAGIKARLGLADVVLAA